MMDKYQETFQTWNKIAKRYEEKFMNLDLYNDTYDAFCKAVSKKEATILDVGCGPGNITKYLLTKQPNFRITGIDISENMIQLAQKNNPTATFKIMDSREIRKIPHKFDAIIAGFCLPYLSKKDCRQFIVNCKTLLNSSGLLYLSFVAGNNENSKYLTGSNGDRVYFYYHNLEVIKKELMQNEFQILAIIDIDYPKVDGSSEIHTIVLAKK